MDPRPPPLSARPVVAPFADSWQQARRVRHELVARPLRPFFGRAVHLEDAGAHGGQAARGWSSALHVVRRHGTAPLILPVPRTLRRRPVGTPGGGASRIVPKSGAPAIGLEDPEVDGPPAPPPSNSLPQPRVRHQRDKVFVDDYVVDTLAACIRLTCGLPSSRPMGKYPCPVTARVIGDSASRSRAIVLRSGAGKADVAIMWVSCQDGLLCSCFCGTQNALFLSVSSRSTTCKHTTRREGAACRRCLVGNLPQPHAPKGGLGRLRRF